MIIVSQDKLSQIYTENIIGLDYQQGEIIANGIDDNGYELGMYEEDRAIEILEEISNKIASWKNLEAGQPSGLCVYKYVMPKE